MKRPQPIIESGSELVEERNRQASRSRLSDLESRASASAPLELSSMPPQMPFQIEAAIRQLQQSVNAVEQREVDLYKASWADIEKAVIKLLGGGFQVGRSEHQAIALGLTGVFSAHLQEQHGAFWFPNREALEGAALGFPDALLVLSPFGAVVEALSRANLAKLDEVAKDIGRSLSQVRFSARQGGTAARLTAADYQRLFDPAFIQFVAIDPRKAKATWEDKPDRLAREIRDALSRLPPSAPADLRKQLDVQLSGGLGRLDPQKTLVEQIDRAMRLDEVVGHLFATTAATGSAPEELWENVVLPLLLIGAPDRFPPIEQMDLQVLRDGAEPLLLFVDLVPHQTPGPEEGYLGVFELKDVAEVHPAFTRALEGRLLKVKKERLHALLERFEPARVKDAVSRFGKYLAEQSGKPLTPAQESSQLLDASIALLGDLKKVVAAAVKDSSDLCTRQLTEAEALSDGALDILRRTLQGPRIILTG